MIARAYDELPSKGIYETYDYAEFLKNNDELLDALNDDNLFWRLTAQRLIVEKNNLSIANELNNTIVINGDGLEGEVSIAWCVTPRKKVRNVLKIVSEINPDAYVTTESTNPTKLTGNRK